MSFFGFEIELEIDEVFEDDFDLNDYVLEIFFL